MPNTPRNQTDLISLFPDNILGDITEQDARDLIVSVWNNVDNPDLQGTTWNADIDADGNHLDNVGDLTVNGVATFTDGTKTITLDLSGMTSGQLTNIAIPDLGFTAGTKELVFKDTTAALTNKTVNGLTITSTTGTLGLDNSSSLLTSGAHPMTLTATGTTSVVMPTTGTLATLAGSESLTNKVLNGVTVTSTSATLNLASGSSLITGGAYSTTINSTATTNVTLPTSGVLLSSTSLGGTGVATANYGACGSRPAASRAGNMYFGSDANMIYLDDGTNWHAYNGGVQVIPPITASYTWSHGGGTATNTDITNGPSFLQVTSTGGGDKISKFVRAVPATPYVYTVRLSTLFWCSNSTMVGVCWADGTANTNKFLGWGLIGESQLVKFWTPKYNTLSNYNGEYVARAQLPANYGDVWLQLLDNGTTRDYNWSVDGVNFMPFFGSVAHTDFFTPTHVGVFVGTNASSGYPVRATWLSANY